MLAIILWGVLVLIIIFAIVERSIKSTITAEAQAIYERQHEKIFPPTLKMYCANVETLKIHNSALDNFHQYFVCNAGIFLFPLHPSIATFAMLHSLCFTISLLATIICFFFRTKLQSILYLIPCIYFFYFFSPSWYPLVGRDDANIERASANHFRTLDKHQKDNFNRNRYINEKTFQKNDQEIFNLCRKIMDFEIEQRFPPHTLL